MKFRILIIFAIFAYALAQETTPTSTPTTKTTEAATTPSTAAATTPSTAAATTPSTAAATTPSTAAATTPSTPTPTTPSTAVTGAPNTGSTPTSASTLPPTSATPTKQPDPAKAPDKAWYIEEDGKYCVLFKAGVQFAILYRNDKLDWVNATINVPTDAVVLPNLNCSGTDMSKVQDFGLTWPSTGSTNYTMKLQFTPVKDNGYVLHSVSLSFPYDTPEFNVTQRPTGPGYTGNQNISISEYELQSLQDSYLCMVDIYVDLSIHDGNHTDTVRFSDLQFLAYKNQDAQDDFGYATECDADFTNSDIVPIAVGCALAALVVIVLIAYLIGRKRSRQKGYQSV